MNYGEIKYCDIANGEGVRTTLFVSGCTHGCKGCFQPETWDFNYGQPFTDEVAEKIFSSVEPSYIAGLTVLGGEPMEPSNQEALVGFLKEFKKRFPNKTIWLYTGDTYEDLLDSASDRHTKYTQDLLSCLDVMIDGPYCEDKADITARFRGSSNQRIIDVPVSQSKGFVIEWKGDAVLGRRGSW